MLQPASRQATLSSTVYARSTTYNSRLWGRLRNDSRGIFFMQWPTAQMRHVLCSCLIDRPGSLCPFFHRVCTLCRRIRAHCDTGCTLYTQCTLSPTLWCIVEVWLWYNEQVKYGSRGASQAAQIIPCRSLLPTNPPPPFPTVCQI